jgi:phosphatidylglycerophosphatase A
LGRAFALVPAWAIRALRGIPGLASGLGIMLDDLLAAGYALSALSALLEIGGVLG